jgi:uncharacterized iron-regulated membrane protein
MSDVGILILGCVVSLIAGAGWLHWLRRLADAQAEPEPEARPRGVDWPAASGKRA